MTMSGAPDRGAGVTGPDEQCRIEADAVVIVNANTTIGYARFSREAATLDYIFVSPAFRRRGYGRGLVALAENACGRALVAAPPLSPLGRDFAAAVGMAWPTPHA